MAEGELDVDSLISRLLEGEFVNFQRLYYSDGCDFSAPSLFLCRFDASLQDKDPLYLLSYPGGVVNRTSPVCRCCESQAHS